MLTIFKKKNLLEKFIISKNIIDANPDIQLHQLVLKSKYLNRNVQVRIYLPKLEFEGLPSLILNDGQDMEQLKLVSTLTKLFSEKAIQKIVVVAVHANEQRMQEYGVAGHPDFKKRGKKAGQHEKFIIGELVPYLQAEYKLLSGQSNVFAGFSLGGLSALDITWRNTQLFRKAGVFSGSFWWRSKHTGTPEDDNYRIMHKVIRNNPKREGLQFWFQTGTKDEPRDRNNNGIIDSIDDTRDLIKELKSLGYSDEDIKYEELKGGEHNFHTWSKIFPDFLKWAFPAAIEVSISKKVIS